MPTMTDNLTLADARRIIDAAERKATEIQQPMNIAVADAGGNLIAHIRMDGAWMGSVDISIKKAWTSRAFDINMTPLGGAADILQPQMNPHSKMMTHLGTWFAAALVAWWPASIRAQDTRRAAESLPQAGPGDWPIPAKNYANTRYSDLADIN